MIKRLLYSSPLFAGIFWIGLMLLAFPLATRITIGHWNVNRLHAPETTVAALVLFAIWGIIVVLAATVERHYQEGGK